MKKKMLGLLLAVCIAMALVPVAAFAEGNSKTSITTVDELLQFAKAVDQGEYDHKTDAVVSLDADLDLTGVAWTPIGSVFAADGTLLHYFSGKFYGNGHTISNLDFSENYGKTEYPSFGFFSEVSGAEISGLTIQGKLDVSNSGYVYFGTVAGVAADSKISDCVSDVSFTDTEKYINGTVALCGYAINSTIEYCQNKGNFSITKDVTSFQMGGIVGLAQNSTVQYCANTGDMTSWASCTGGIVGQLYQASKIINCYSTGKIVPLGKGTTDFGGIAGVVGAGTEIRHCYFAGKVDVSQYTATTTTTYKRLGGIAGGVSSEPPVFENNYFTETENVTACNKHAEAGTAKSLEYMKREDFFNEITAAGGNYRFNPNGTPVLPAPKYAVSFVVTPAGLTNIGIKVNGQEVTTDTVIGTTGSTGSATGSQLYLELVKDGEYYNPVFYISTGDSGLYGGGGSYDDETVRRLFAEADKYLGMPYVWGGSSPETSFDCSGFVSYVFTNSGVCNMGRLTAQGIYDICMSVSPEEARPGDIIFFTGTYDAGEPVTHVGIYAGDGQMIHCGNPIQYTSINSAYWQSHFYAFGRP